MEKNFMLESTEGKEVSLEDFKGKKLVLYFYSKDNTAGCTTEALEFSELYPEFQKLNTEILGISKDTLKSHIKFKEKNSIPFNLLADPERLVHANFDVLKNKKMCGKDVIATLRSTFIFDEEGNQIKEFKDVKAKGHASQVLDYIKEI